MASPVIYDQDWQSRHIHSSEGVPVLMSESHWVTRHWPALTWADAGHHPFLLALASGPCFILQYFLLLIHVFIRSPIITHQTLVQC